MIKKWHKSILVTVMFMVIALIAGLMLTTRGPGPGNDSNVTSADAGEPLDFERDVLKSPLPVLVDFWAPWCGPCRILGPIIHKVAEKTGGKANVIKINVDEHPEIAQQYRIRGIPTVMIFRNGKVDKTLVGVKSEQTYLDAIGI